MSQKKILMFVFMSIILNMNIAAQDSQADKPKFKRHYYLKKSVFEVLPNNDDEIIFLGNSITAGGIWTELFQDLRINNRGISGDVTDGILFRLDEVTESNPSKIFIMIGVNDLSKGKSKAYILMNYQRIIDEILNDSPETKIYIQSILPVNNEFDYFKNHTNKTDSILSINDSLKIIAADQGLTYIDLFSSFANEELKLNESYTFDGLHLNGQGYLLWKSIVEKYIY
jgi:lysophospholipase L1-like esterase